MVFNTAGNVLRDAVNTCLPSEAILINSVFFTCVPIPTTNISTRYLLKERAALCTRSLERALAKTTRTRLRPHWRFRLKRYLRAEYSARPILRDPLRSRILRSTDSILETLKNRLNLNKTLGLEAYANIPTRVFCREMRREYRILVM